MSNRGAILLGIGMLLLGLLIGIITGGVTGFFLGQSSRPAVGQFFQQGFPQGRFPNQQQPNQRATPTPQPGQQQPNQTNPFNRRGNNGNGNGLPPASNVLNGARVSQVYANSPAAQAGLQVGDIITAVDTTKLDANHALSDLIQAHKPGDKIDLSITRGSQTMMISVTLGASSSDNTKAYLGIEYSVMPGAQFRFPNG